MLARIMQRKSQNTIVAILLTVRLTLHQQHFFGQAVRSVGLLWIPIPQIIFLKGDWNELRTGADGTNGNKPTYSKRPTADKEPRPGNPGCISGWTNDDVQPDA